MKYYEKYSGPREHVQQGLRLAYNEDVSQWKPETHVYARLRTRHKTTHEIYDEIRYDLGHNLIVRNFGVAVASLLKTDPENGTTGVAYMAVGQGEGASWDTLTQDERAAKSLFSLTSLYDEVGRVGVEIVYLDPNNIEVDGPTNKLEIRALITPDISGDLREIALFSGPQATTTADSGLMINHKTFIKIPFNQDTGLMQTLAWAVRLTL